MAKKKPGRPRKPKDQRRSKNRTFRVRGQLDEFLVARADESGRSVSEEIEARLERSFYMDGLLNTFAGDAAPITNALATAVAASFLQDNLDRNNRYQVLQVATGYIIAAFGSSYCPRQDPATSSTIVPKVTEMLWPPRETTEYEVEGLRLAYKVLENLGSEVPQDQTEEIAQLLLEKAGGEPMDAAEVQKLMKRSVRSFAKAVKEDDKEKLK